MTLGNLADVQLGGAYFLLDEGYIDETGRRCYVHGGRTILADDIIGTTGRNLKNDRLRWFVSDFNGEGQVVFNRDDPDSAGLFYQSEGLDFRTPGQARLNKSSIAETPVTGAAAATTYEGNADFADITGSSSTSGTDRRLNTVADKIGTSANYTPGASNVQADFYLYREAFADYATTVNGSAMKVETGDGTTSGTTFVLNNEGSTARTATKSEPGSFAAGTTQQVQFNLHVSSGVGNRAWARCHIADVTNLDNVKVLTQDRVLVFNNAAPTTASITLNFVPKASHDYRFYVHYAQADFLSFNKGRLVVDTIVFGNDVTENTAVIEVWNQSGGTSVTTKTVAVNSTATGLLGSVVFPAIAATNYRFRVKRNAGQQRIWVDKVTATLKSATTWTLDCLDFGAGQKVWMGGHAGGADSRAWNYNTTTDVWDDTATFNDGAATANATVLAMTHSDSLEYFLLNNNEVYTSTTGGVDDRYAYFAAGTRTLVGMTVAQERLILMAEDSSGVIVYSLPLDGAATPYDINSSTAVTSITISAGSKSADTTLRQRMCSSPTGARFYINYADVTAKVYEVDASGASLTYHQLNDLGTGVKATSITYEGGITFIGGQFYGDATASDTDKLPRAALWAIDQNSIIQRIGFMRRYSPDPRAPVFMVPYQTDLFIFQGVYVWRYSLITGGLFLEYQLDPLTAANCRALAVLFGRTMALYSDEVWVTGSVSTYRQSSVTGGNSFTTSINDLGLPGTIKSLTKVELMTDTMPASTQTRVEYQIDQSGTWVQLGTATSGTRNTYFAEAVTFTTIQFRVTLSTLNGISTPTVKSLIVEAKAAEEQEYFDLELLCGDPPGDSTKRILNEAQSGNSKAQTVIALWRSGVMTTFVDGYASETLNESESYLVTIDDLRDERNKQGEGRVVVTLGVVR